MKKITVTQPHLPEISELTPYLTEIWNNNWLTNNGPFHQELEKELCVFLNVEYVCLFNNATIALIIAIKALELEGEVITTPYSFIATTHAIEWNSLKPVFVDIEKNGFNIDTDKIEAAITDKTSAILPVHCYGNPCEIEKINDIAKKYNLKVIYDAAHAFGIKYKSESLLNYGDLSVVSFHATKVFNTFEGGAIITNDVNLKNKIEALKNFGLNSEGDVTEIGLNGKMSEFNAAFGLVQLKHINESILLRKKVHEQYMDNLSNIDGLDFYSRSLDSTDNFSYFPIIVKDNYRCSRDELHEEFAKNNIITRKYFYPLISNMKVYKNNASSDKDMLPNANYVADRVICVPIFSQMQEGDIHRVLSILRGV